MNRGVGLYGRVESGTYRPSTEYLHALAKVLGMSQEEYRQVHLLILGSEPLRALDPDAGLVIPEGWPETVEGQADMACLIDRRFTIAATNAGFRLLFNGGATPANLIEWILFNRDAREHTLKDWAHSWVPDATARLRAARAAHPGDAETRELLARADRDPEVRKATEVGGVPRNSRRRIHHPGMGPGWVTLIESEPVEAPGARHITLLFARS
ncbi:hypothetical protein AB0N09_27910 [Streptomyces erythrochromogenes]|uniref:MmyB family transcriptional regulator n=1 Tax=Streptomyces erythrochromogenes TaxID=285574 RepID=UPI003432BC43